MTSTAVARHKLVSIHRKTSAHPRGFMAMAKFYDREALLCAMRGEE